MFGTGETFPYAECEHCGTLQLLDIPPDLSVYYPSGYYSFGDPPAEDGSIERAVKAARAMLLLKAPGRLVQGLPSRHRPVWADWFRGVVGRLDSIIVDIGSGSGRLVTYLHNNGFRAVVGYDPFVPEEAPDGLVPIYRAFPPELMGKVRVAMLHHSLEHVTDPREALAEASDMIVDNGAVIVRIPLADSFAWRTYREDWIALDPPRHVHLLTERAMEILAAESGLRVAHRWRDASSMQFWGSEQLRQGIVLEDERSLYRNGSGTIFSDEVLREYERRTIALNASNEGDCGCFVLRRS